MRPITIASGQFGDMSLEELCALVSKIGYNGIELATHAHFDVEKALNQEGYIDEVKGTLKRYGLECYAISAHLTGQCVGDVWDPRLDNFAPNHLKGKFIIIGRVRVIQTQNTYININKKVIQYVS